MKFQLKRYVCLLLTLAILAPLCIVPARAATINRQNYAVYIMLRDEYGIFRKLSVGGSSVEYTVTANVPNYVTREEEMKLVEDAAENSIVIDMYSLHIGSLKGLVIRSKSAWHPDYKYSVILYVGSGTERVSYDYLGAVPAKAPSVPAETSQKYGESVPVAASPSLHGYDFSGWTTSDAVISGGSFAMPDSHAVTLSGSWAPRMDTHYIVERYQQNTDNDGYSLQDTDHYTGTTDTIASVPEKSYLGFTVKPPTPNVVIQGDGSSIIKLYYDRNVNTVSYAYANETDVTPPALPAAENYRYGQTVALAAVPTLPGYDFGGWTTIDATVRGSSFTMPTHNVVLSGSYLPRADTPYTVEFYKQDAPGSPSYTKQTMDTISSTGTTDTQIRAALNLAALNGKYAQYSLTDASKNDATTISGNGGSVLRLYYDKTAANVSYLYIGNIPAAAPVAPVTAERQINTIVSVEQAPVLAGYDFSGWTTTDAAVTGGGFVMLGNDVTFTGSWTPRTDTPYTVEYYQQHTDDNNYTLADTEHCTGTTDTVAAVPNKSYPGFTATPESLVATSNVSVKGDGSTTLNIYFNRNVNTVSYSYAGETDTAAPALPITASYRFGQAVPVSAAPSLAGYDFGGWETSGASVANGSFTMPDSAVRITGAWMPRTDTPYTVEYYQQNIEDDGYTLADTEHCTGTTGDVAMVPDKSYPGFSVTPESTSAATNVLIKSNGTTVLKLYYDRNINTVSYAYSGETDVTPPLLPAGGSYRYGQTVSVAAAPSLTGYDFGGWETSDASITGGSFTMPDASVNITGEWIAKADTPYVVEYYQQNTDDDAYTLAFTFNGTGITGMGVPHKEFEGFTQTPDSLTAEGSAKIRSDGTTLLKLYYDRNTETVTYTYSGETDVTPPELPAPASYRFGQTVPVAAAPSLAGYDFGGWKTSDAPVVDGSFTMPDETVTLIGAWTTRTDIPYVIEYYQQNTEDDGYTLADTLNGEGAIGGSIPHREFEGFTETPDSVTAEGNARIRSDGSTVLKLYYDRDYYAVSFAYSGTAPEAAPALPERADYRYGASVLLPIIPGAVGGMSFSGWIADSVQILGNTLSVPAQDTQITGDWTPLFDSGDAPIPDTPVTTVTLEDNGTAYIIGYEDGAFRPDDYLTAKHETLMLSRLGLPVTSPSVAPELSAEERYITRKEFLGALLNASGAAAEDSEPMTEAAALGWISGYGDGGLYPDAYITRAQAVTIINRAFGRTAAQSGSAQISYTDIPRDYWAYDAIMAASTTA